MQVNSFKKKLNQILNIFILFKGGFSQLPKLAIRWFQLYSPVANNETVHCWLVSAVNVKEESGISKIMNIKYMNTTKILEIPRFILFSLSQPKDYGIVSRLV